MQKKRHIMIAIIITLVIACSIIYVYGKSTYDKSLSNALEIDKSETQGTNGETSYIMQVAHAQVIDSQLHELLEVLKVKLEEESKGSITVEIYPACQLGSEEKMLAETQSGGIQSYVGEKVDNSDALIKYSLTIQSGDEHYLCYINATWYKSLPSSYQKLIEESIIHINSK